MFALCAAYPFFLAHAASVGAFLFAMAIWGLYFDLYGLSAFNLVSRHSAPAARSCNFAVVQSFRSLGLIIAPLVAGALLAGGPVNGAVFSASWTFLGAGFIILLALIFSAKKLPDANIPACTRHKDFRTELRLWRKLARTMSSPLLLTFYLFFIEAFFWTLAPLYAESSGLGPLGGLFLAAYCLPALLVGALVGPLTARLGKKRTGLFGLLAGSLFLSLFSFSPSPTATILLVFFASLFTSLALPAINGAYADYISEAGAVEGEIESLEDFSFNAAYVLGPILAGFLDDGHRHRPRLQPARPLRRA